MDIREHLTEAKSFLLYLWRRYNEDGCTHRAAALTYMSLFALVPLMTVVYAMAAMVPAFNEVGAQIQDYLFNNLVPASGAEIQSYMVKFSEQAKNLTGAGIGFLIVTAILMLRSIENTFNTIWRTEKARGGAAAFMLYWAVLSLAPLSVGVALGITTYLASLTVFFDGIDVLGAGPALLSIVPTALGIAAATLVYITVPNCRVPFLHALSGSIVVIILFQVAQALFTLVVVGSSYAFIYGAFAALPLFLLWLNLTWQIILFGGILVHAMSAYQREKTGQQPLIVEALAVLHLFWEEQKDGKGVKEAELLHNKVPGLGGVLHARHWDTLRERLLATRILQRAENGEFFLTRDLDNLTLFQLRRHLEPQAAVLPAPSDVRADWLEAALTLLNKEQIHEKELLNQSLPELFEPLS